MSAPNTIVAFSGHMTDAPDRPTPRFPESRVPAVRAQLRAALQRLPGPVLGVCSAARGADLTFLGELLSLGGRALVLLPFPKADFKRTSVGQGWDATFDRLLDAPGVSVAAPLHVRTPTHAAERDQAFADCNTAIVETALASFEREQAHDLLLLSVYHATGNALVGGTLDAMEQWQRHGGRVEIIDPLRD